ncbi:hypothetical protein IQ276_001570 [Desmonostoc muscorum LEGE 12446]|uniref:hypothetical protein n=1 Tax=Desmonostoc muscorum TaxID=1179 RepID=UPI001F28CE54|nr:hypothetical protein [Desmonostoc muscorum]MCF2145160.1 hypothetical protein [Desmonostoc muscorum LEGE 12446]
MQYCVGFGISWLRQAVLDQGKKSRLALSFASPASPASRAYPSSIGYTLELQPSIRHDFTQSCTYFQEKRSPSQHFLSEILHLKINSGYLIEIQ